MRRHSFLALSGIGTLLVLALLFALGLQQSHPSDIGGGEDGQMAYPFLDPAAQEVAPMIETPPLSALDVMPKACPAPKA